MVLFFCPLPKVINKLKKNEICAGEKLMFSIDTTVTADSSLNEIDIMVFIIGGDYFGVHVADIKEIMMSCTLKKMQKAHNFIEGIFKSRDKVVTVIDLAGFLGLEVSQTPERDIFIISTMEEVDFAFHVHSVVGINGFPQAQIKTPDKVIYGKEKGVIKEIADNGEKLISILDLAKIIMEVDADKDFLETLEELQ